MPLPSSGQITMQQIQNEFGGSHPIGLNEYYAAASGIPGSGQIGMNSFHGKSNNVQASGGTIQTTGGYRYHIFTGSGTFSVTNSAGATMQYLVVAGMAGAAILLMPILAAAVAAVAVSLITATRLLRTAIIV